MLCFLIYFHCYVQKAEKIQSSTQKTKPTTSSAARCSFYFPSFFPVEGNVRHFSKYLRMSKQIIGCTVIRTRRDGLVHPQMPARQGSVFSHKVVGTSALELLTETLKATQTVKEIGECLRLLPSMKFQNSRKYRCKNVKPHIQILELSCSEALSFSKISHFFLGNARSKLLYHNVYTASLVSESESNLL